LEIKKTAFRELLLGRLASLFFELIEADSVYPTVDNSKPENVAEHGERVADQVDLGAGYICPIDRNLFNAQVGLVRHVEELYVETEPIRALSPKKEHRCFARKHLKSALSVRDRGQ
jgi:hypothetical protein